MPFVASQLHTPYDAQTSVPSTTTNTTSTNHPTASASSPSAVATAASPSSPTSSYGSSSSSFRPVWSSSSSVNTSPPCHTDHHPNQQTPTTHPPAQSGLAELISPRGQQLDLLKVQRDLYQANAQQAGRQPSSPTQQHRSRNVSAQMYARPSATTSAALHTPIVSSPDASAEASTSAASPSSANDPSSSHQNHHASTHHREETQSTRSVERGRGSKSRRASSGGSRIPERARADSDATPGARDRDSHMSDAQHQPFASTSSASSSSSSSSSSLAHRRDHGQSFTSSGVTLGADAPSVTHEARSPSHQHQSQATSSSASPRSQPARQVPLPHLDLATYPSQDLLRVLAALLSQIALSNDAIRPPNAAQEERERNRHARNNGGTSSSGAVDGGEEQTTTTSTAGYYNPGGITTAAMGALGTPSSTLCFHARNVPSISIESYLLRILKYCPTTNDVFLSLLVYFDRMSRVALGAQPGSSNDGPAGAAAGLPEEMISSTGSLPTRPSSPSPRLSPEHAHPGMKGFAVDSYNVHRLVIAGVTAASKFFSDVFYTNSRYAKVGGLPVHELNQLELQFLLLNDFKLVIPLDELQSYANQLLVYATGRGDLATNPVRELDAPDDRQGSRRPSASRSTEGATAAAGSGGTDLTNTQSPTSARPADRSAAAAVASHHS